MKDLKSGQAYIDINGDTITVHHNDKLMDYPIKYNYQKNSLLCELLPDPTRTIMANILYNSRETAYKGEAGTRPPPKVEFSRNYLDPTNNYLKREWQILGECKTNSADEMFLANATSNIGTTWKLTKKPNSEGYKEIYKHIGKYPKFSFEGSKEIEEKYIRACTKGLCLVTRPLIKSETFSEEINNALHKFTTNYPAVEATTDLYMWFLLANNLFEECEDVYENHCDSIEYEPSSTTKIIYNSIKSLKEKHLEASLYEMMSRYQRFD